MDDIRVIRMQSGEDIVASYMTDDEGLIFISNPMVFVVKRNENFMTSIFLTPWLPIDIIKNNVAQITKDDILTILQPTDEFREYYIRMVIEEITGVSSYENINDMFNTASIEDLLYNDIIDEDVNEDEDEVIYEDEIESLEVEGTKTIH